MKKDKFILNLESRFRLMNPLKEGYRNIRFKARGIVDNNWYFGTLLDTNNSYEIISYSRINDSITRTKVKEKTICQYTTINDINGIPIYEHDIVKHKILINCETKIVKSEVIYHQNEFVLFVKELLGPCRYQQIANFPDTLGRSNPKVIGNIYNLNEKDKEEIIKELNNNINN